MARSSSFSLSWIRRKQSRSSGTRRSPEPRALHELKDVSEPDHSEAVAHLRAADPVMAGIIERVGPCLLGSRTDRGGPASDHYGALLRAIVGQQLSVSAARSIYGRLVDRYGGPTPSPPRPLAHQPGGVWAAPRLSRAEGVFLPGP